MWWLISAMYLVGSFFACRMAVLYAHSEIEKEHDKWVKRPKPGGGYVYHNDHPEPRWGSEDRAMVTFATVMWPIMGLCWLAYRLAKVLYGGLNFLMFPKGVKTKYAKEKERAQRAQKLEEENRRLTEEIEKLSKEYDLPTPQSM